MEPTDLLATLRDIAAHPERHGVEVAHACGLAAEELGKRKKESEPTEVSIHGMYDIHLFHRIKGRTVDEVIANWLLHNAQKQPAIVGGEQYEDLGPSNLCPAIVLSGKTELRRVGPMVFPRNDRMPKPEDVEAYRSALLSDPDIPRLLAND